MKKPYVKPRLYAERFELVEHIAGGCITGDGIEVTSGSSLMCIYYADNISLYTSANCHLDTWLEKIKLSDPETWPMECYNALVSGPKAAFSS